jgi:CheY-like chemotaxis protein
MNKNILWIEDESFMIKGLLRPMEKLGYAIDIAKTAQEGYEKAQNWKEYDILIVDLIIPLSHGENTLLEEVKSWEKEPYIGIGLAKWLADILKVTNPIILLSVVNNPIMTYDLGKFGLKHYISKSGLLPSRLQSDIMFILGSEK